MEKISDYHYNLPEDLIAQKPSQKRDHSRLLVLHRGQDRVEDTHFYNIFNYLQKGDLLVVNNTRVMPARLLGVKKQTGALIEIFLLNQLDDDIWEVLSRPAKRLPQRSIVEFRDGADLVMEAEVLEVHEGGRRIVRFSGFDDFDRALERVGHVPLPPYIKRDDQPEDRERYQTVFAKERGAVAAPTAGLHFTPELMSVLRARGVEFCEITLHVGIGTFRPIEVEDLKDHDMHEEYYSVSEEAARKINQTISSGHRVVAVGTTSVRTLETVGYPMKEQSGFTDIFIRPPYEFKVVGGLITNFHLPHSSLLVLVSALAGREKILEVYKHAVAERYRFFSYGDAMLII